MVLTTGSGVVHPAPDPASKVTPTATPGGLVKVTMRSQMSGSRDGVDWPAPGEEIELPDDEAQILIHHGMAVEAAVDSELIENTAVDTKPRRGRPPKSVSEDSE